MIANFSPCWLSLGWGDFSFNEIYASKVPPKWFRLFFDYSSFVLRLFFDCLSKYERRKNEGRTKEERRTNEERTKNERELIENLSRS